MPSITLHPRPLSSSPSSSSLQNPLPRLLQTPSGLALVEIQGTLHYPPPPPPIPPQFASDTLPDADADSLELIDHGRGSTPIGTLTFPLYHARPDPGLDQDLGTEAVVDADQQLQLQEQLQEQKQKQKQRQRQEEDEQDAKAMKKVYLYVGRNQRMQGEVRKLVRPVGVVRRRRVERAPGRGGLGQGGKQEELQGEELEIVEIVRWKVVFGLRPEPVGGGGGDGQEMGG